MAQNVVLDAMIERDDFAVEGLEIESGDTINSLSVETIGSSGMLMPLLRKPDFQRETNHWNSDQIVSFLESFLDNELIPSVILWRSNSYVFVIDGGHRLSALRAWIEDDYGDGKLSIKYFSKEISEDQKRIADRTRKKVHSKIGTYLAIKDALVNPEKYDDLKVRRARIMATRSLTLQWVSGDSEKAETSFFKINTKGTALDSSEEFLLRNRRKAIAISARSIVRAGTGHEYWSKFSLEIREEIVRNAKKLHKLVFDPEVSSPIKTLDLPLGGNKSPISSLEILMNMLSETSNVISPQKGKVIVTPDDLTGEETVKVLKDCLRVINRISGNEAPSLGLHPAVYFYSERGRHIPDLFLGFVMLITEKLRNNDSEFFRKFTAARSEIEKYMIAKKSLITQSLQIPRSRDRAKRVRDMHEYMIKIINEGNAIEDEKVIEVIAPNSVSKIIAISQGASSKEFASETKSMTYLRESLKTAIVCSICNGLIDARKSMSYDHKVPVREGGMGDAANAQLTHPYCNTGIKS